MTQPTFAQYKASLTAAAGLVAESLDPERLITLLAVLASGQNPDGTAFSLVTAPTPIAAANVLDGFLSGASTAAAATIITVPQGRTWIGTISVSVTATTTAAATGTGRSAGLITVAGAGATPPAGSVFQVSCEAAANAAGGTVGTDAANWGSTRLVVIAPAGNAVTIQGTITISGSVGEVSFSAIGELQ